MWMLVATLMALQSSADFYDALHAWVEAQPAVHEFKDFADLPAGARFKTERYDCFSAVHGLRGVCVRRWVAVGMLAGGTKFAGGRAGPERNSVLYDPAHRLMLLGRGCCSYYETLLVSNVQPPPRQVRRADLSHVRTFSGLTLGAGEGDVRKIFGAAPAETGVRPQFTVLRYQRRLPGTKNFCVEWSTFVFKDRKLAAIEFYDGC